MFIKWLENFANIWGNNPLVSGLILLCVGGICGFLFTKLLPWLWKKLVLMLGKLWLRIRRREESHDFEHSYLNWLIDRHSHLGLIPAQIVARRWGERQQFVQLEKIYVRLSISTRSGDELWSETYGGGSNRWRKRPWYKTWPIFKELFALLGTTEQTYQMGDLGLAVDRHKRLVIRGDPGSGKSTLLRYLTVTCARTLRNDKAEGDSAYLVKERLFWDTQPFPILVNLRRHSNVANWGDAKGLIDTFLEEMPPELRKQCPPGYFEKRLQKGNCLILLDGFDELGNPEARSTMARRISGFLQMYNRHDNRIVVTTRIVGYEGQLDRYDFIVRTVENLGIGEIRALVKQRYRAIAISETVGRTPREARAITERLGNRSERLIEKIESTPRLSQLATNPMLLSLIVLVHFLKVELPEERLLLYRDCVEILTERWQQVRREEAGVQEEERDELTLSQKLVLLREIAFMIQQKRKEEGSPSLIPKSAIRDLIAEKLPDFLGRRSLQSGNSSQEIYFRKAEEWIEGIQTESGILVEQGLDEGGEPLIGFSHLTFQEYLAAVALHETETYQPFLWRNLFAPAWREVILLYAALTNDATSIITFLIESPTQPEGLLLAGYCLAEHVQRIQPEVQQLTLSKLKASFSLVGDNEVDEFGKVLSALVRTEIIAFMRTQLSNASLKKRVTAIKILGQTREDDPEIADVQVDLVEIVEAATEIEMVVAAREALDQIGDPRFSNLEPVMMRIPQQAHSLAQSPRSWKELITSPIWINTTSILQRFDLVIRFVEYLIFTKIRIIWSGQPKSWNFEIGKYPITNRQYQRFVEETEYNAPKHWIEGVFPPKEATHPIVNISVQDAEAYCKWLRLQTGMDYRLPTEWEWEFAAAAPNGWRYPWGNQFDKDKCNTEESGLEGTTPVGSYREGRSSLGLYDMSGNIWEMTYGVMFVPRTNKDPVQNISITDIFFLLVFPFSFIFPVFSIPLALRFNIFFAIITLPLSIILSWIFTSLLLIAMSRTMSSGAVSRGGAWNVSAERATCFYRKRITVARAMDRGFRCVKYLP